jgi:SagB-type dehydrogenase family enzyme
MQRATVILLCTISTLFSGCEDGTQPCDRTDAGSDASCPRCDASCGDADVGPAESDEEVLRRVMAARRSIRQWSGAALSRDDVDALFWAAQGITAPDRPTGLPGVMGFRTSPSAGATYPLEMYVLAESVEGLDQGVYWYHTVEGTIEPAGVEGSLAADFADACSEQPWVGEGAANFVIAAVIERTAERYGPRGTMYVHLEAGHAAQNMMLMAVARGLGTVAIGAFDGPRIAQMLGLPEGHDPMYIVTVGHPGEP